MNVNDRIFVAGSSGMVGSAIIRKLKKDGFKNIVTRSHTELDLTNQVAVKQLFTSERIDRIILAAAKVGGIHANSTYPAEFIYNNLIIQANVIHQAYLAGIHNLLFLGSSCIYPKVSPQPMKEEYLLSGVLEPTNEPYAIAKIAGIKLCEAYNRQYTTNYRSVMPTNLYGPGDNYNLDNSHVIPALLRKFHLAKLAMDGDVDGIIQDIQRHGQLPQDIAKAIGFDPRTRRLDRSAPPHVIVWGSGTPHREFLHVDDMAEACLFVMNLDQSHFTENNPSFLNIGYGKDITIRETANIIAKLTCFTGETIFNTSKPDGTTRKLLDSTRIRKLGWKPHFDFQDGLKNAYKAYMN